MFQVLVLLNHANTSVQSFRQFEAKALSIINSHGGRLVSAFVPHKTAHDESPDEIHLIEFPSENAFDDYRNDPETIALASERDAVISKTLIYTSDEFVEYADT